HTRFSRDWSSDVCSSDLPSNGRTDRSDPFPPDRRTPARYGPSAAANRPDHSYLRLWHRGTQRVAAQRRARHKSAREGTAASASLVFAGVKFSSIRKPATALEALSTPAKRLWAQREREEQVSMSYAAIHPDWEKPRRNMVDGYSLEMTAKELDGLREAAPLIRPGTQVAVTFLPGEEMEQRVDAA